MEATASYHRFVAPVVPPVEQVVLANPDKLRVIAESTKKTDRLDARTLAESLAPDMIPRSSMPTPRQCLYCEPIRHRQHNRGQMTAVRNELRRALSDYDADRRDLFSPELGQEYTGQVALNEADRVVMDRLRSDFRHYEGQLKGIWTALKAFAKEAPHKEREVRAVLAAVPGAGPVTIEVVLGEPGDVGRFRNAKTVCAYAGLAPVVRQSGSKRSTDLGISSQGPGLLRWALVEASWRTVRCSAKWKGISERIAGRSGGRRAIVAVARKLLCVLYAMLKTMTPHRILPT